MAMNPNLKYNIGWICAISTEYTAARAFLDETYPGPLSTPPHDANEYTLGRIGVHNVVIAVLPDGVYGTSEAAIAAQRMLDSFPNVRVGLMVGIGGGAPSRNADIRLGDVVVSSPRDGHSGVIQYDFGKAIQDQEFRITRSLNLPPDALRAAVTKLKVTFEEDGSSLSADIEAALGRRERLRSKYGRPPPETDRLFLSHIVFDPENPILTANPHQLVPRPPRRDDEDNPAVFYGLIASANRVMKDANIRDRYAAERNVLCFEMEAAGLMNHFPCLVVRGICDYSDSHKNDAWQGYAAMAAAAYAKALLLCVIPTRLEAEAKITDIISKEISGVKSKMAQISSNFNVGVLQTLRAVDEAAFDSKENKDRISVCQEGTRLDLIRKITQWAEDPDDRKMYWLSGMAGTGKSTLARTMAERFTELGILGATFFFAHTSPECNRGSRVFTTIVRQLVRNRPEITKEIVKAINKLDDIHSKDLKTQFEKLIITPLRNSCDLPGAKVVRIIIIDAVDECAVQGDIKPIILHLSRLFEQTLCSLKVFVTSRPDDPVLSAFRPLNGMCYREDPLQDITQNDVAQDIRLFFKVKLREIQRAWDKRFQDSFGNEQLGSSWPDPGTLECLVEIAVPLFIFAATAYRFVKESNFGTKSPKDRLDLFLQSAQECTRDDDQLAKTYLPVLRQFDCRIDGGQSSDIDKRLARQTFRELVGPILLAYEPLSIRSLACLTGYKPVNVKGFLSFLGSVLNVPESDTAPVTVLHASFSNYLLDNERIADGFHIHAALTHRRIALGCLRLLSGRNRLRYNICNMMPGDRYTMITDSILDGSFPPPVRYACLNWVSHVEEAGSDMDIEAWLSVHQFLSKHLLHFIEAAAIMGKTENASHMLQTLLRLVPELPNPEIKLLQLRHLLEDSIKFFRKNVSIFAEFPLQVYWSSLVFSPTGSWVREHFRLEIPSCVRSRLPRTRQWTSFQLFQADPSERSGMFANAFSPDSRYFASCNNRGIVRLWSADTGTVLHTFRPSTKLDTSTRGLLYVSLAFSRDSKSLIATCYNRLLIYCTETGNCLSNRAFSRRMFEGATHIDVSKCSDLFVVTRTDYTAVVFSFNVHHSCKVTPPREQTEKPPRRPRGLPRSFACFSPDGRLLAVSFGRDIHVWQLAYATKPTPDGGFSLQMQHLYHHRSASEVVCPIHFLPSNSERLLVVRKLDGTISKLNIGTKDWTDLGCRGQSSVFGSMAISFDGKLIAHDDPSGNGNVLISHLETNELIHALDLSLSTRNAFPRCNSAQFPRSIFLSGDGTSVVTVADNLAVKWPIPVLKDTKEHTARLGLSLESSEARRCFIHNCKTPCGQEQKLVSTHQNGQVKVWSLKDGRPGKVFSDLGPRLHHRNVTVSADLECLFYSQFAGHSTDDALHFIRFDNSVQKNDQADYQVVPFYAEFVDPPFEQMMVEFSRNSDTTVAQSKRETLLGCGTIDEFSVWSVERGLKLFCDPTGGAPFATTPHWTEVAYTARIPESFSNPTENKWVYTIRILNWQTKKSVEFTEYDERLECLAISPNSAWVASAPVIAGKLSIWERRNSVVTRRSLIGHNAQIRDLCFSSDSTRLLSGDGRGEARIWSTSHSFCVQIIQIGRTLRSLKFFENETILVTDLGKVSVIDAPSEIPVAAYPDEISRPSSWSWYGYGISLDGQWITWNGVQIMAIPKDLSASPSRGRLDSISKASPGVAIGDFVVSWINPFYELCAVEFHEDKDPFS